MTKTEKAIIDFCGHHADWWPSTTQVQEMLALAQPEQEPVAIVSGYYGGQCVILPIDPARIFNSNTALYTKD